MNKKQGKKIDIMKKLIAILLAVAMLASMAVVASAASMTMTTTVPNAGYTLVIPQSLEVPFEAEYVDLGRVEVTDTYGFREGTYLRVRIDAEPFTCTETNTEMYYKIFGEQRVAGLKERELPYNGWLIFERDERYADGTLYPLASAAFKYGYDESGNWTYGELWGFDCLVVHFDEAGWAKLEPGKYDAVITFHSQIMGF